MKKIIYTAMLLLCSACANSELIKQDKVTLDNTNFENKITLYHNQSTGKSVLFSGANDSAKSGDQYVIYVNTDNFSTKTDIPKTVAYFNDYSFNEMKKICGSKQPAKIQGPILNGNMGGNNIPLVDDSIGYIYSCQ